jgi:hypothetical protein
MKREDVFKFLPMLVLEFFLDWFVFIWGREQFSKMSNEISPRSHYYLKDFKRVYYVCCGLLYGNEDQTLLIDDEPNKVIQNPNWSDHFLKSFKGQIL